jgi:hypothetical protein
MTGRGQDESSADLKSAPKERCSKRCDADQAAEAAPGLHVLGEDLRKR